MGVQCVLNSFEGCSRASTLEQSKESDQSVILRNSGIPSIVYFATLYRVGNQDANGTLNKRIEQVLIVEKKKTK